MASTLDYLPWFKNFLISPTTDWRRFINPQFNVTINEGDVAIENHVLSRAGSYGKQLGRMQEVLDVLLQRTALGTLSAEDQRSLDKYRQLRTEVVTAVNERKALEASETVDDWLDELVRLRKDDRTRFDAYAVRLNEFLRQNPPERN